MFAAGIGMAVLFNGRQLPQLLIPVRMLHPAARHSGLFQRSVFLPNRWGGFACLSVACPFRLFARNAGLFYATSGGTRISRKAAEAIDLFSVKFPTGFTYFSVVNGLAALLVGSFFHISMAEGTGGVLMVFSKDLLAFALTVTFAAISYHFVEKPFLRFKKKYEIVSTRSA